MVSHSGSTPGNEGPVALVLDDDQDLRELLSAVVEAECRGPCVSVASYEELVRLGPTALQCRLAILDVNLGTHSPSGLAAYRWLRDHAFTGRIVFLTGHARTHGDVRLAEELDGVEILQKPVSVDEIDSVVRSAMDP